MEARKIATRVEERIRRIGQFSDGSDAMDIRETRFIVTVAHALGLDDFEFDHDPTDDEVWAAIPNPPAVRPSNLAERVEAVAELATAWQALTAAAGDAEAFTVQERARLTQGRDLVRDRIKALL